MPKMIMKFWVGYAAPAGTPQGIVDRLNKEIAAALVAPDARQRFTDLGLDTVGNTPAQATKLVSGEMDRWAAVVKAAGIKPD
jgi:tripartite-type tricarboxylate transporter receptor subunit TctC